MNTTKTRPTRFPKASKTRLDPKLKPRLVQAGIKLAEAALALRQLPREFTDDFETNLGKKLSRVHGEIGLAALSVVFGTAGRKRDRRLVELVNRLYPDD